MTKESLYAVTNIKGPSELKKVKKDDLIQAIIQLRRQLREARDINYRQLDRLVDQDALRVRIRELEETIAKHKAE